MAVDDVVVVVAVVLLAAASAALGIRPRAEMRALTAGGASHPDRRSLIGTLIGRTLAVAGRADLGPASRRRRAQERQRVVQALGALAAELEAGQLPRVALTRAGGHPSVWPATLAAVQMDGEVAAALGMDARKHDLLRQLAACWQVGAETGAGLAASVSRLASAARAAEDVRVDLEGQLAGPRATARMLALLPLVGIGFGVMLGSDPLAWLLGSMSGRLCLLGGVLLMAIGMWWTGRIAAAVERLL